MFGLSKLFQTDPSGVEQQSDRSQKGVQLLGAMLVCYPEVSAVTYEPGSDQLELSFVVRQPLPGQDELESFADFLQDSLEAYHELEEGMSAWCQIRAQEQAGMLLFNVSRNLADLSRGELEVIAELVSDRFGKSLVVDSHTLDSLEPEFVDQQSCLLDQMIDEAQEMIIRERMIGLRENDRVVVFNR